MHPWVPWELILLHSFLPPSLPSFLSFSFTLPLPSFYINNVSLWTSHWKGLALMRKDIWILDLYSSVQDGEFGTIDYGSGKIGYSVHNLMGTTKSAREAIMSSFCFNLALFWRPNSGGKQTFNSLAKEACIMVQWNPQSL